MNYILFVSNKESVNPYYIAAWKNLAVSNGVSESNIKFQMFSGTEKTYMDSNEVNEYCKCIVVNWMGQKDDKSSPYFETCSRKSNSVISNFYLW